MIAELLTRLRFFIFRKKGGEVDDEFQFHLEQSIAAKTAAGLSASEARRQALIEFGGVELAREQCDRQRPGWWVGIFAQDMRYALRGILAHRWFSAAIILTLALGIGLNTMVFTLVNAVLFKPVPVPNGVRLVCVGNSNASQDSRDLPLSYPDFEDYRAQATSFESFEATTDGPGNLTESGNPPKQYHLEHATAGIFSMVQGKALLGRTFLPAEDHPGAEPVLVLSYDVWQERYGGRPDVIGRHVHVNEQPATIIGVMPKGFQFPNKDELWMPLVPTPDLVKRDNRTLRIYALLKPGPTLRQANAEMNGIAGRLASQFSADKGLGASVLTFHQRFNGGGIRIIFLLMLAAVGFVLLIACADVANMMLSRSLSRQREMSIRTALGASRWRIVRQLLIESVALSSLGGVLGLSLAAAGVSWFDLSTAIVRPYWIQFTMNFSVFGYFAALCILSGLLFGIAPALRSSKVNLVEILKEGAHSVGRHRGGWLSAVLVVFQFALTLVLLTGAGIFIHGLLNSFTINRFIPATQLTTARLQLPEKHYKDKDARERFFDQLLPRLRAIPSVWHAAIVSDAPGLGAARQQIEFEHLPVANPAQRPWISLVAQSPGYFDTIRLPLLRGRAFNEIDGRAHHEAAILTRDAATRLWPGRNPIGKRFRIFDDNNKPTDWITVIGISADVVQEVQESDPKPLLFVPYRQEGWGNVALVVESATDPLQSMRRVVESLDPELPLSDPYRLDKAVEHQVWFLSLFGKIFSGFALIAMLMASVGIYAVIAHATSSRTQEIGVRIALGATMRNILMLVMRRGLWQIFIGLAVGLGGALPLAYLMAALPIGVPRSDPAILIVVASTLALVGVIACWIPARHAAGLDPVKA
ncbi:MAG TPA: ABC transporter permease, partial [Tepidisphaeraceae bacterium]|nr:ABC transporter permease [Tepidisphaeraceae bacterium]